MKCVFCKKIVEEVLEAAQWQSLIGERSLLKPKRPIFRWTFRKAARIKEIPESFIITFREIPTSAGEGSQENLIGLPDLTFYLLHEQGQQFTSFLRGSFSLFALRVPEAFTTV